jgi:hypothetical protein
MTGRTGRRPRAAALLVLGTLIGLAAVLGLPEASLPEASDRPSASPAPSARLRNGGYRVEHYLLQVAFDPQAKRVRVHATVTARSTRRLTSLLFRFSGLDPHHLTVEYQPARYDRLDSLLRIIPHRPIEYGRTFIVTAAYEGAVSEMLSGRVWTGKSGWRPLQVKSSAPAGLARPGASASDCDSIAPVYVGEDGLVIDEGPPPKATYSAQTRSSLADGQAAPGSMSSGICRPAAWPSLRAVRAPERRLDPLR